MFVRVGIPVRAAWIAAGLLLAACAQAPDKVRINIGTGLIDDKPARDYAALYLPYAKMSSIAYTDAQFLTPHAGPNPDCPDPQRLAGSDPAGRNPNNRRWLAELNAEGWRCLFGLNNPRECPQGMNPCDPLRGLELHVWTRRCEAVIAFRGTDYDERGDWLSNLRWFLGPAHLFDEYRQVQFHMSAILRRIRGVCRSPHIVVTGHSLGGGLAQHAAYAAGGSVRYVYAFDPSPVIGYFDVPQGVRMKAREGLGIDYVYEVGEVLDAPRYILGGFANPQPCNPRMRIVRFNTIAGGSGVVQHAMQSLTGKMQEVARGGNPAKAREENKTKNCTYV
jgi:hypothetical protein